MRHNSKCSKATKVKTKNKNNNITTMLKEKTMIVRKDKKQHPFIQIFKVCKKELLQCDGSNLTLSFHGN